ncbi:MAG: CvpA family protein [Verrucomicrobiota bacterium]
MPSLPDASPTLWIAGILLLMLMIRGAWRGYKRGPLRQLAGPFSLTVGLLAGWIFGPDCGHACLHGTTYPWLLRGATGLVVLTCLTGLLCYTLAWWLGKRPEGQDEAESPISGSLVGCWTGALYFGILVGILASIASIYDLIETPAQAQRNWFVQTRNELAATTLTAKLKTWSPIPLKQRRLIGQVRLLMADSEARKRLMAMPEIRALATHPTVYQAWEDKKVRELLTNNDLSGFIDHPKVRAILADEDLQKQADSVDLSSIIDRSLQKPLK